MPYLYSTHVTIAQDSLLFRYVGEMITSEEAEERGKKYDAEGRFENLGYYEISAGFQVQLFCFEIS